MIPHIEQERVTRLNEKGERADGRYVLYWMQASQREEDNHALEFAAARANILGVPLVVWFGVCDGYPGAVAAHYEFMFEGLNETRRSLERRGVRLIIEQSPPPQGAVRLSREACCLVTDCGYTRLQREWRTKAARSCACACYEVETDVVVPVKIAYPKEAWSAAVLRPKINFLKIDYLHPAGKTRMKHSSLGLRVDATELDIARPLPAATRLRTDGYFYPVRVLRGGTSHAKKLLSSFAERSLKHYHEKKNDPSLGCISRMSPYLQFGQLSPGTIARTAMEHGGPGADAFIEELIVRRELSANFVHYNAHYDSVRCLPEWALRTLKAHARDRRGYLYTMEEFEAARTHDRYWNAAQREMLLTGHMHGYMRMYWGKKIIEWSRSFEEAYETMVYLNNRYELDGRGPNAFAGIAWCFGKHDRPWGEREVFGTVRYMNAAGLKRKFNPDRYADAMEGLERALR